MCIRRPHTGGGSKGRCRQVSARIILVEEPPVAVGGVGLYARVSSYDQRADLDRQVARLTEWAAQAGQEVVRVEAEVGSGVNGPSRGRAGCRRTRRSRRWRSSTVTGWGG